MESKELVKKDDMANLFSKAIDKNVSVETMEKLMVMRRELKAEWAKEQFDIAMAKFQAECPIIKKTKKVDFTSKRTGNRTTYSFAPLESIVEQVGDTISSNGFSYTTQTKNKDSKITSTVSVRHRDGHQEETDFEVPIDPDSFMNEQQKYASASTFSKRYAFLNAFGILTGDEDDDSNSVDTKVEEPKAVTPAKPIDMEHYCKVHETPMRLRADGKWDHRRRLDENMEFDEKGNWYWCQGQAWHLSVSQ